MPEYIYDTRPFGTFSYDRDGFYDAGLFGSAFVPLITKKDTVIDVGCGEGYALGYLTRKGVQKRRLYGVDLSKKGIAFCKKQGFSCAVDDNTKLRVSRKFDAAISNGVIHHTGAYEKSFREVVRVTKKKGKIFLSVYWLWHPYFLVYTCSAPIRWLYRRDWGKFWVFRVLFPVFRWLYFVPIFLVFSRQMIDRDTALTLYYDQVLTPIAEFRSKKRLFRMVEEAGCTVVRATVERGFQMVSIICRKN